MKADSTPPDVRAWLHRAKLLLWAAPAGAFDKLYWSESLLSAAVRLRVEDGQCPPVLQRN